MQPNVMLLANVRNVINGVKCAIDGGSSGAVDEEGQMTLALVTNDQALQFSGNHATPNWRKP